MNSRAHFFVKLNIPGLSHRQTYIRRNLPPISGSELQAELGLIRGAFSALAEKLGKASSGLSAGLLPSAELGAAISDLQTRFAVFSASVLDRATAVGLHVPSDSSSSLSYLDDLITKINNAEKHLESKRRNLEELIANLDCVLTLERTDGREFPPLTTCQDSARDLRLQVVGVDYHNLGETGRATQY